MEDKQQIKIEEEYLDNFEKFITTKYFMFIFAFVFVISLLLKNIVLMVISLGLFCVMIILKELIKRRLIENE